MKAASSNLAWRTSLKACKLKGLLAFLFVVLAADVADYTCFYLQSVVLDVVLFVIGRNGIENIGEEYPDI